VQAASSSHCSKLILVVLWHWMVQVSSCYCVFFAGASNALPRVIVCIYIINNVCMCVCACVCYIALHYITLHYMTYIDVLICWYIDTLVHWYIIDMLLNIWSIYYWYIDILLTSYRHIIDTLLIYCWCIDIFMRIQLNCDKCMLTYIYICMCVWRACM
jgi:hypothetical protein